MPGREQLLGYLPVPRGARELEDDFAVPVQPKPCQAIDNGVYGSGCGTLPVGVFDPQQHFSAMAAGIEPVEQSCPAATDMQETGGRGGKTGDDRFAHREPCITVGGKNVSAIDIEASATSYGPREKVSSDD